MQFAPLYPVIYRLLKARFPACLWSGEIDRPVVALTFDDGPHPIYTPQLLEVLDHYAIPASFFWLGLCVQRSPTIAKAVYERGHKLGLHGFDHQIFPRLSAAQLRETLENTQAEISAACQIDASHIRDVRPPNGMFTPQTLRLLLAWNYRPVMWSVVPEDWTNPGVDRVVQRVLQQVQNGSLIVLHDGYCGGANVAEVTRRLIPALHDRGYQFTTVDALWNSYQNPDSSPKSAASPEAHL